MHGVLTSRAVHVQRLRLREDLRSIHGGSSAVPTNRWPRAASNANISQSCLRGPTRNEPIVAYDMIFEQRVRSMRKLLGPGRETPSSAIRLRNRPAASAVHPVTCGCGSTPLSGSTSTRSFDGRRLPLLGLTLLRRRTGIVSSDIRCYQTSEVYLRGSQALDRWSSHLVSVLPLLATSKLLSLNRIQRS